MKRKIYIIHEKDEWIELLKKEFLLLSNIEVVA
jgi:hypothetical protein